MAWNKWKVEWKKRVSTHLGFEPTTNNVSMFQFWPTRAEFCRQRLWTRWAGSKRRHRRCRQRRRRSWPTWKRPSPTCCLRKTRLQVLWLHRTGPALVFSENITLRFLFFYLVRVKLNQAKYCQDPFMRPLVWYKLNTVKNALGFFADLSSTMASLASQLNCFR